MTEVYRVPIVRDGYREFHTSKHNPFLLSQTAGQLPEALLVFAITILVSGVLHPTAMTLKFMSCYVPPSRYSRISLEAPIAMGRRHVAVSRICPAINLSPFLQPRTARSSLPDVLLTDTARYIAAHGRLRDQTYTNLDNRVATLASLLIHYTPTQSVLEANRPYYVAVLSSTRINFSPSRVESGHGHDVCLRVSWATSEVGSLEYS